MKTRFDLEQELMAVSGIQEDLRVLYEGVLEHNMSPDDIANALLGLEVMYGLKFAILHRTFETMVDNGDIT